MSDIKYSKSIKRLEEIIEKIENEEIDVDELSEKGQGGRRADHDVQGAHRKSRNGSQARGR